MANSDDLLEELKQMIMDLKHKVSTPLSKEGEGLLDEIERIQNREDTGDDDWWEQGRE